MGEGVPEGGCSRLEGQESDLASQWPDVVLGGTYPEVAQLTESNSARQEPRIILAEGTVAGIPWALQGHELPGIRSDHELPRTHRAIDIVLRHAESDGGGAVDAR